MTGTTGRRPGARRWRHAIGGAVVLVLAAAAQVAVAPPGSAAPGVGHTPVRPCVVHQFGTAAGAPYSVIVARQGDDSCTKTEEEASRLAACVEAMQQAAGGIGVPTEQLRDCLGATDVDTGAFDTSNPVRDDVLSRRPGFDMPDAPSGGNCGVSRGPSNPLAADGAGAAEALFRGGLAGGAAIVTTEKLAKEREKYIDSVADSDTQPAKPASLEQAEKVHELAVKVNEAAGDVPSVTDNPAERAVDTAIKERGVLERIWDWWVKLVTPSGEPLPEGVGENPCDGLQAMREATGCEPGSSRSICQLIDAQTTNPDCDPTVMLTSPDGGDPCASTDPTNEELAGAVQRAQDGCMSLVNPNPDDDVHPCGLRATGQAEASGFDNSWCEYAYTDGGTECDPQYQLTDPNELLPERPGPQPEVGGDDPVGPPKPRPE